MCRHGASLPYECEYVWSDVQVGGMPCRIEDICRVGASRLVGAVRLRDSHYRWAASLMLPWPYLLLSALVLTREVTVSAISPAVNCS